MSQQPDKLFREKLRGYERPVSGNAWERVAEHLHKKNSRNLWLKVAAAVLALVAAGGLLLLSVNNDPAPSLAEKTQPADHAESPSSPALRAPRKALTPERKQASGRKNEMKIKSPPGHAEDRKQKADLPAPEPSSLTSAEVAEVNPSSEPTPTIGDSLSPANTKTETRMTIVFSAQEVNDKYLETNEHDKHDKKDLADATSVEKKTSSFQSLLKRARDLKHNQDPLGDLRQKKNDILAFNFKPGKGHDQN